MASSGVCVERQMPPADNENGQDEDKERVARAGLDDALDERRSVGVLECGSMGCVHYSITPSRHHSSFSARPAPWLRRRSGSGAGNNALAFPPVRTPPRSHRHNFRPSSTKRGSNMPSPLSTKTTLRLPVGRTALPGWPALRSYPCSTRHPHTSRSKFKVGVRKDEADAPGAFGVVDERINQINRAAESFVRGTKRS